ncbi:MAG: thioesterase family protein [Desulfobacula sp.]|uniref:thioesterase family protein n=1 Tax=Desulfobacula sp. TaxID=2593537 RepID=UPI0025BD801E|nr:thioesterase family protein [Desulfobacula sp.]MCD4718680.1 thioesterase family protein [Desulfobacula sp.]
MIESVLEKIKEYYLEMLPFNKVLGIDIDLLDYKTGNAVTSFNMTKDLIGNPTIGILHGGVTASVIDLTGGLSALLSCAKFHEGKSLDVIGKKLASSATIDMRVDYLRPGKGHSFQCKSRIIRAGSRIVVTKIDLYNEKEIRIATGTATYLIG